MVDHRLAELIARARDADGSPPFSDGALVELAAGDRELIWLGDSAALATASEAEFVVDPAARRAGLGGRMLALLLDRGVDLFWAHGDHPAARALARAHGLEAARTLLHLEAPVPPAPAPPIPHLSAPARPDGPALPADPDRRLIAKRRNPDAASAESEAAAPGTGESSVISRKGDGERATPATAASFTAADSDAWLALNARAFADHPEQGRVTKRDLATLRAEPWFAADDFLLLRDGDELIGYVWLKVEGPEGEFYVVGVSPDRQGEGWGRALVELGLARLASQGIRVAHLYVEGDNEPALKLYRGYGFSERSVDIQYRRHRS